MQYDEIMEILQDNSAWLRLSKMQKVQIFRSCHLVDWDNYLDRYPDVRASGVDPVTHYVMYGKLEGRTLNIRKSATEGKTIPAISLIVNVYNNACYLDKCIRSVLDQSFQDMEIIIVDDCSCDNSLKIINDFQKKDTRISVIRHTQNLSSHIGRKEGVAKARGKYIMFLDADDYLANNACERAYLAMSDGWDVVCFRFAMILPNGTITTDWLPNQARGGIYEGQDVFHEIFITRQIPISMWSKIYKTDILKSAFSSLSNDYLPMAQDLYADISICSIAKNILKIDDILYFYRWGDRISYSPTANKNIMNYIKFWDIFTNIAQYDCVDLRRIKKDLLRENLLNYINFRPIEHLGDYIFFAASRYGIFDFILELNKIEHNIILFIARKLHIETYNNLQKTVGKQHPSRTSQINTVMIYIPEKDHHQIISLLTDLDKISTQSGKKIIIITHSNTGHNILQESNLTLINMVSLYGSGENCEDRLIEILGLCQTYQPDVFIHFDMNDKLLFPLIIFTHYYRKNIYGFDDNTRCNFSRYQLEIMKNLDFIASICPHILTVLKSENISSGYYRLEDMITDTFNRSFPNQEKFNPSVTSYIQAIASIV